MGFDFLKLKLKCHDDDKMLYKSGFVVVLAKSPSLTGDWSLETGERTQRDASHLPHYTHHHYAGIKANKSQQHLGWWHLLDQCNIRGDLGAYLIIFFVTWCGLSTSVLWGEEIATKTSWHFTSRHMSRDTLLHVTTCRLVTSNVQYKVLDGKPTKFYYCFTRLSSVCSLSLSF